MDSLRSLRQVLALAEAGNYRKAAAKIGITHSALSQTISKLEEELGASLFVRDQHETVPTAFGGRLIEAAEIALGEISEAKRDISLMRNLEAGRLVVGADPTISESLLGPALAVMMEAYPKLRFTVMARNWKSMEDDLLSRKIDLFVGLAPDRLSDGLAYRRFSLGLPVVACRADHPLASRQTVKVADLLEWPVVGGEAPDWFLEILRAEFPDLFPDLRTLRSVFLTTHSLGLLRRLLLSTDAVSLIPRQLVEDDVTANRIALLEVVDLPFQERLPAVIATLDGRPEPPAATELIRHVLNTARNGAQQ